MRLLGPRPEDGSTTFRAKYLEGNRDVNFTMRQPPDFYTGIFAWGGAGRNTVDLPFASDDITFSTLTPFGNASLQFSTPEGTPQTIQLNGVRRVSLLDTDINIRRLYRRSFGASLPSLPQQSDVRWRTSKLWNGEVPDNQTDTITGSTRNSNNFFHLSSANVDTTVIGTRSDSVNDTLFVDEYLNDERVRFFPRNRSRANIRISDVNGQRTAIFRTRRLENIVFRDTYLTRSGQVWLEIANPTSNPLGGTEETALNESNVVPPPVDDDPIFNTLPDIFNNTSNNLLA